MMMMNCCITIDISFIFIFLNTVACNTYVCYFLGLPRWTNPRIQNGVAYQVWFRSGKSPVYRWRKTNSSKLSEFRISTPTFQSLSELASTTASQIRLGPMAYDGSHRIFRYNFQKIHLLITMYFFIICFRYYFQWASWASFCTK